MQTAVIIHLDKLAIAHDGVSTISVSTTYPRSEEDEMKDEENVR